MCVGRGCNARAASSRGQALRLRARSPEGVHEAGVAEVAVEEGEGGDALVLGEHRRNKDDARLVLGPPLLVRAADHAEDLAPHASRVATIEGTCKQ